MHPLKHGLGRVGSAFGIGMVKLSGDAINSALKREGDLSGVDFYSLVLSEIIERCTILNGWFNKSRMTGFIATQFGFSLCEFREAEMHRVGLKSAILDRCDFFKAQLLDADFRSARINNCSFDGADLRHADFTSASLKMVDLRGANLQGASFIGATLNNVAIDRIWTKRDGIMVRL